MRSPKHDNVAKEKALTIHIDTDQVGPHGMPLVYGSTPDGIGSIKGVVRFSSNYDCKGRDIQIIYEAWTESHWTTSEPNNSRRPVHHHSKEVLSSQTISFTLMHTKPNGSRVVAGEYQKEFEIPLASAAVDNVRHSLDSTASTTSSSLSASFSGLRSTNSSRSSLTIESIASLATTSTADHQYHNQQDHDRTHHGKSMQLPCSHYGPNTKTKHAIRAVLRRPFPSLSNVEASQEIWVINSVAPIASVTAPVPSCLIGDSAPYDNPSGNNTSTLPAPQGRGTLLNHASTASVTAPGGVSSSAVSPMIKKQLPTTIPSSLNGEALL
ncbi:hypothetical protein BGZ99_009493 [Dissophora globulifera]|uniref:Uncharacterized protein n=1 Tax=Dissophora globulifera TaxID=979702 RepID=A0A9P6UXU5_9FUNG|nr:hypothetical protein BGZ99_009493 [Dissophora globulifera]